ncbi:non-canonical purine NTP pyrophosphatase [Caulobacter sp. X]|uniref:non-canonical purine NTP pyrophosphatase n=1 Tax=Caulobacter sp. X TaxID=2048901 RepID=UPI000C14B04C|nr:non-canonical purine NTP pyrophosphatase [Caulobacter sp. X]PIC01736.1 non-canonical purine NTP pyrophosphatase [Caulobacter sp. X]
MKIHFLSSNPHKIAESKAILEPLGFEIAPTRTSIAEIQTSKIDDLIRHKLLKAFYQIGRPIFVEHTSLSIDSINGFPGGLTQIFWDTLEADRVSELFGQGNNTGVTATTHIGYCDGKKIWPFSGEVRGHIAPTPRGDRSFQWDCIFVPEGGTETFAEMGTGRKNEISMRRRALDAFAKHLRTNNR